MKTKTKQLKVTQPQEPLFSLRPGFLVSLSAITKGGIQYHRDEISTKQIKSTEIAKWNTERRIEDIEEYDQACKVRNNCRYLVRKQCLSTAFGLICLTKNADNLNAAIAEAKAGALVHNQTAKKTFVTIRIIRGRIADGDREALSAIGGELKELVQQMRAGIQKADVKAIRETAARAREIGQLLGDEQQAKIGAAVKMARKAATEIVKRVTKDGEEQSKVIESIKLDDLAKGRFAWLDTDELVEVESVPAVDTTRFAEAG